ASVLFGVEMRGRDLQLAQNAKVMLSYVAIDQNGKIKAGNTDSLAMPNLKPETRARIEQTGLRVLNRLDLPPGKYQLRVAAHDTNGGNVGSVQYDLNVPDFQKAPFSVSGVVLTSGLGAALPTVRADEQLKPVLPGPPISLRSFPQNDEIALFAEVYDNEASKPHKVDIVTMIATVCAAALAIAAVTIFHEDTKIHEAHELCLYKLVLRDLRGSSCFRDDPSAQRMTQTGGAPRTIEKGEQSAIDDGKQVLVRTE